MQPSPLPSEPSTESLTPYRIWIWAALIGLLFLLVANGIAESNHDAKAKPKTKDLAVQFQDIITKSPTFFEKPLLSGLVDFENQADPAKVAFLRVVTRSALSLSDPSLPHHTLSLLEFFANTSSLPSKEALDESASDFKILAKGNSNEAELAMALQQCLKAVAVKAANSNPKPGSNQEVRTQNRHEGVTGVTKGSSSAQKTPIISGSKPAKNQNPKLAKNQTHPSVSAVSGSTTTASKFQADHSQVASSGLTTAEWREKLSQIHPTNFVERYALALAQSILLNQPQPLKTLEGPPRSGSGLIFPIGLYSVVFFCGLVLLPVFIYLRGHDALPNFQHPAEATSQADGDRLALQSVGLIAMYMGVSFLIALNMNSKSVGKGPSSQLLLTSLVEMAILVGTIALTFWKPYGRRLSLAKMGLTSAKFKETFFWGLGGFCVALALEISLTFLLAPFFHSGGSAHPITKDLGEVGSNPLAIIATFLTASVGAPFFEEMLFRGTLTPALRKVFGSGPNALFYAILASSFVFGAGHPTGPPSWIPLGSIGVVNCILCYQTRSLWPAIICHGLFNGLQLMLVIACARHGFMA